MNIVIRNIVPITAIIILQIFWSSYSYAIGEKHEYCVRSDHNLALDKWANCRTCWSYMDGDAGAADCIMRRFGVDALPKSCEEPQNKATCIDLDNYKKTNNNWIKNKNIIPIATGFLLLN